MAQTSIESQLNTDTPWCPWCFLHGRVNPVYSDPENDFFGCDACSIMWTREKLNGDWKGIMEETEEAI